MAEPPPPPPRYPVYTYPPLYPAAPVPHRPGMPGLTTTAVVLMWVMVGLGALGSIGSLAVAVLQPEPFRQVFPGLGSWMPLFMAVYAAQGLTWAALRAYLAVRIARRSAGARGAAIAVESIGLAFQVAFALILLTAFVGIPREGNVSVSFDCTGLVLPILVLIFLSAERSRQWCDR